MQLSTDISTVVHVIQLAVAPVFLLICIVIATLFVGAILAVDVSAVIAALFIVAMLALIAGLLSFLREIFLAAGGIHVTPR